MDALTAGAMELIGTSVEVFQGEKYRIRLAYGPGDTVTKVLPSPDANKTQN